MINRLIYGVDQLNRMVGHAFAWCILILTFGTSYEVFVRYALSNPTSWAFDMSYLLYGALFFMSGAYTLSRNGHVRGDFLYRTWRPRTQGIVELTLYVLFFFPGVLALVYAGWSYGLEALRLREASVWSPVGVPVWQMKILIPFGAGLLTLQGFAEVLRCIQCIRDNGWPQRLHDVEELESAIRHEQEALAKRQSMQAGPT
ncbi:MAG TPA: TRAP transporter small permease subunit [Burkholderiales bacterium]|jgi:TRAP-type mannitol/chloroaromatic compound transport system permease small subunit